MHEAGGEEVEGTEVAGIELASAAAAAARARGLNVLQGCADEDNFRRIGHADVVVLLDVIEHLPDPRETLALCRRFLNPGGLVVITTGDFGSLAARLAGARWRLMTPPQHLWFFTVPGLRALATDVGCGGRTSRIATTVSRTASSPGPTPPYQAPARTAAISSAVGCGSR